MQQRKVSVQSTTSVRIVPRGTKFADVFERTLADPLEGVLNRLSAAPPDLIE